MLLAIPFQGFASATMLVCAPMPSLAEASPVPHDHQAMLAAAGAGEHHHAAGTNTKAKAILADAHEATAAHHHAGGKCNACASCCFGAAMAPSGASRVPAEVQHLARFSFEPDRFASVDLALPERPRKLR